MRRLRLGLGAVPVPFTLSATNQLQPDLAEIAAKITPRTRMLLTNSPGNPTGTVYTDAVQRGLAELAVKHDLWVLSDEIYARIIYGSEYLSMLRYPGMAERTLIIDGFSKSFAMTGWRLGYTVAPPEVVSGAEYDGGEYLHLRCRIHAVCRHRCFARPREQYGSDGGRVRPPPRPVCARPESRAGFSLSCRPTAHSMRGSTLRDTGISAEELCRILLEDAGVAAIPGCGIRTGRARTSSASRLHRRWRHCRKRSSAFRKCLPRGRERRPFVNAEAASGYTCSRGIRMRCMRDCDVLFCVLR